ncbi:MAG: hypothetical protein A2857_04710 [Candidatus Levybacteria bacterium RIFCSPHIGHO2_01_FULL_36_15]|nr:MAG: hypothetical protein A2857_04710 [Candidatus Levybacteria bacterium RIFCSPHIGHO2_01_FULL_36_15]OGH39029.1 MAG: hypothetical protein A2905_04655 [Candidatus Levybacteria bacterium RIFCSPLOWO2_01_FULL_36_10]
MYNWNTDTKELEKNPEEYTIWKLEQLINYGLDGEKLNRNILIRYWSKLRIDPIYKEYLHFLLWPKQS